MELIFGVGRLLILYLHNRGPIDRSSSIYRGCPKGMIGVIFGLKDSSQKRVFISCHIPSRVNNQAFVHQFHISNSESTLFFGFANVIPRAKHNGTCVLFFLNSCPPKPSKNCVNICDESFGEKNSRNVINRNRS